MIPNYTLGIVLIIFFAGGSYFELVSRSVTSFRTTMRTSSAMGKGRLDFLHHMVLPMICYLVGEFAFLVMLMKNSMLDELGRDYIAHRRSRRSLSFKQAIWRQAFRNALIPIATGIGAIFYVLFSPATLLIERVFDLDGMGMLTYNSILSRVITPS